MKTSTYFIVLIVAALILFRTPAWAEDESKALGATRSLKCYFSTGVATEWIGSKPKTSDAGEGVPVVFDSIDVKRGTARVISNGGAGDVAVLVTGVGITFIETALAVVDVTTVFPVYGESHEFLAVDTRHVRLLGKAVVEEYYGACNRND